MRVPVKSPTFLLLGVLVAAGCAGARVRLTVDRVRYPLSLSPAVRDAGGHLYDARTLEKVGWLDVRRTTAGLVYSALAVPPARDFSDAINAQVAATGGFRSSTPCPSGPAACR